MAIMSSTYTKTQIILVAECNLNKEVSIFDHVECSKSYNTRLMELVSGHIDGHVRFAQNSKCFVSTKPSDCCIKISFLKIPFKKALLVSTYLMGHFWIYQWKEWYKWWNVYNMTESFTKINSWILMKSLAD